MANSTLPANFMESATDFLHALLNWEHNLPHNADVMHLLFLYHMRLNGVEVVREIH